VCASIQQSNQCGSYGAGREGAGLRGVAAAGVTVGADGGAAVGLGWKLVGIGEEGDRRGSLGPAGESTAPVLDSALTFCKEDIHVN